MMELAICERWSVLVQLLDGDDGVVGVVGVGEYESVIDGRMNWLFTSAVHMETEMR